eukprot:783449-Pyramimonas_sp.AAC.1
MSPSPSLGASGLRSPASPSMSVLSESGVAVVPLPYVDGLFSLPDDPKPKPNIFTIPDKRGRRCRGDTRNWLATADCSVKFRRRRKSISLAGLI